MQQEAQHQEGSKQEKIPSCLSPYLTWTLQKPHAEYILLQFSWQRNSEDADWTVGQPWPESKLEKLRKQTQEAKRKVSENTMPTQFPFFDFAKIKKFAFPGWGKPQPYYDLYCGRVSAIQSHSQIEHKC